MEKDREKTGQNREEITEGRHGSNRSAETATATAGTGTTAGTGGTGGSPAGTAGTAGTAGKAKEKKPVEVAVLVPDTEDKPKKKRSAPKKKKEDPKHSQDITNLLVALSGMVADRPDQEHWKITEEEAKSIADPLSNIIEKSEVFSKIAEHSDSIALATACATVFLPRGFTSYMIYKEKEKEKKKNAGRNNSELSAPANKDGKSRSGDNKSDKRNDRIVTADGSYVDSALYATAEAIV